MKLRWKWVIVAALSTPVVIVLAGISILVFHGLSLGEWPHWVIPVVWFLVISLESLMPRLPRIPLREQIRTVSFWVTWAYVGGGLGLMVAKYPHPLPLDTVTKVYCAIGVPVFFYGIYDGWKRRKRLREAGERAVPLRVPSETLRQIWRIAVAMVVCDATALGLRGLIPFTDSEFANFGITFALASILGFAAGIWWQFAKADRRSRIPVFPVVLLGVVAWMLAVFAIAVGFGAL